MLGVVKRPRSDCQNIHRLTGIKVIESTAAMPERTERRIALRQLGVAMMTSVKSSPVTESIWPRRYSMSKLSTAAMTIMAMPQPKASLSPAPTLRRKHVRSSPVRVITAVRMAAPAYV